MNETYWGSVRFFRHLYTGGFVILLSLPVLAMFYFWQVGFTATREMNRMPEAAPVRAELESIAGNAFSYRDKYPGMVVIPAGKRIVSPGTVYLTFDDGPSPLTEKVLDVLKHYRIRATFFVIGERLDSPAGRETARRILHEGHSLGIHSETHRYRKIYASVDSWLDDFAAVEKKLTAITGVRPTLFRFPGGSINVYNSAIYQELIAEMTRRGYVYFDWNVSTGDISALPVTAETLFANVVSRSPGESRPVVLMHDSAKKIETLKALPKIIEYYQAKGLRFDRLQHDTWPVTFDYRS